MKTNVRQNALNLMRNTRGYLANNPLSSIPDATLRLVFTDLYWSWNVLTSRQFFCLRSSDEIDWHINAMNQVQDELADRDPSLRCKLDALDSEMSEAAK